jgi:hypothetical protein
MHFTLDDSNETELLTRPAEERRATLGFGVPATSDPHYFTVTIPKSSSGDIHISEHLGLQASSDEYALIERLVLDRRRWNEIRGQVQRAFNLRLKEHKLQTSSWKVGENMVDRLLGKELCVLGWAVEQMDMDKIPVAVRNWLALRPEERWWLFGMTALATGGVGDADRGWRIALRHALGDVAQDDYLRAPAIRKHRVEEETDTTPSLFDED